MQEQIGKFTFRTDTKYTASLQEREKGENRLSIRIMIDFGEKIVPEPVILRWTYPCKMIFSQWNPQLWSGRTLNPQWNPIRNHSRSAEGIPLQMHLSTDGINTITIFVSDTLTPMELATGVIEETAEISYKLTLFTKRITPIRTYETVIHIDTRSLPYEQVLANAAKQWYSGRIIPEGAKEPVYSTWYAYHQNLDHEGIIKELCEAKKLGMNTVIVDDGWQTGDNKRGYAYCGDWEAEGLPDMEKFVSDVHNVGMKCMLWYSVPFVGKYSKVWNRFKDKFLNGLDETHPWCVLDPRYPEVREYLINIYEKAVSEWKLDGLKLDFINNMQLTEKSTVFDNKMDYASLEEAICALLSEIKERLTKIKPDILIEFRQPYTGPIMRKYGNIQRAADCPLDAIKNRAAVIDLRLMASGTAIHSDMLMWNYDDTPESAALQIINVIFAVPQVSVLLEKLSSEQKRMLNFYLEFWQRYKKCLIDGELSAHNPEAGYSFVSSEYEDTIVAAA